MYIVSVIKETVTKSLVPVDINSDQENREKTKGKNTACFFLFYDVLCMIDYTQRSSVVSIVRWYSRSRVAKIESFSYIFYVQYWYWSRLGPRTWALLGSSYGVLEWVLVPVGL